MPPVTGAPPVRVRRESADAIGRSAPALRDLEAAGIADRRAETFRQGQDMTDREHGRSAPGTVGESAVAICAGGDESAAGAGLLARAIGNRPPNEDRIRGLS